MAVHDVRKLVKAVEKIIEQNDEETEKRSKACLGCMKCCEKLGFYLYKSQFMELEIEFYKTRGCEIVYEDNGDIMAMVDARCPYLSPVSGCMIYGSRPLVCKMFDGRMTKHLKGVCKWENL